MKARCSLFEQAWSEIGLVDGQWVPLDAGPDLSLCEGLEDYDSELDLAVVTVLAEEPDHVPVFLTFITTDDQWALSSEELLIVAELVASFAREYGGVTPPDYASAWHAAHIADTEFTAGFIEEAAVIGAEEAFEASEADRSALRSAKEAAIAKAISECAIFPDYVESEL
jgi:hypothetical protein